MLCVVVVVVVAVAVLVFCPRKLVLSTFCNIEINKKKCEERACQCAVFILC